MIAVTIVIHLVLSPLLTPISFLEFCCFHYEERRPYIILTIPQLLAFDLNLTGLLDWAAGVRLVWSGLAHLIGDESSDIDRMAPINVLVFGTSGQGKSSLINFLARKEVAKTGNSLCGVTFECTPYTIEHGDDEYTFYDTVGLDEPKSGTVYSMDAIDKLRTLFTTVASTDGFHLAIMVSRNCRVTLAMQNNYKIFVEGLFPTKLPVVYLHNEINKPADNWSEITKMELKANDMPFHDVAYCCLAPIQNVQDYLVPAVEKAQQDMDRYLWAFIEGNRNAVPVKTEGGASSFKRLWNMAMLALADYIPLINSETRQYIRDSAVFVKDRIVQVFLQLGATRADALRRAAEWF